jgi:hypothetical protein
LRGDVVCFLALAACSSSKSNDVPPVAYQGTLPSTTPARFAANVLTIAASVDQATLRPLVMDTGSPLTGIDPGSYAGVPIPADASSLTTLGVGSLVFQNVPSVALTECGGSCGPFDITGVVGGNILRSFVVAFDYRAPAVVLANAAPSPPANTGGAPVRVAFDVAGGGTGSIAGGNGETVNLAPTRIVVQASIEGTSRTLVLDTGSSYTELRTSLYTAVVSDGRAQLGLSTLTAVGVSTGSVARTRALALGDAQAMGSPLGSTPDNIVDNLSNETGMTIDGTIGGSFLRAFYVVIDYAGHLLTLYPYAAADPLADEFQRVGVFLGAKGTGYVVAQAMDTTAASYVGDVVVDVDGAKLDGLDPEAADRLLRGQPGGAHTLHVQHRSLVTPVTLTIKDVLPLGP